MKTEHPSIVRMREYLAIFILNEAAIGCIVEEFAHEIFCAAIDSDLRKAWIDLSVECTNKKS